MAFESGGHGQGLQSALVELPGEATVVGADAARQKAQTNLARAAKEFAFALDAEKRVSERAHRQASRGMTYEAVVDADGIREEPEDDLKVPLRNEANSTPPPVNSSTPPECGELCTGEAPAGLALPPPVNSATPPPVQVKRVPGWLSHLQSFAELIADAHHHARVTRGFSLPLCVFLFSALGAAVLFCANSLRKCFRLPEAWHHDVPFLQPCLRHYYKFEECQLLLCIHKLKLEEEGGEYRVWCLTREQGRGPSKPSRTLLEPPKRSKRMVAQTRTSREYPENVELHVKPSRPDLQLAVYKATRSSDGEYVGSAAIRLNNFAEENSLQNLPREHVCSIHSMKGVVVGKINVSLFVDNGIMAQFDWGQPSQRLPLSSRCAMALAVEAVQKSSAKDRKGKRMSLSPSPGLTPHSITRMHAWARILTGNFLLVGGSNAQTRRVTQEINLSAGEVKYFEMKHKKAANRWFWAWHQRGLTESEDSPTPDNQMDGYVPLRSIVGVSVVPGQGHAHALLVRYLRKEAGQQGEIYMLAHGTGKKTTSMFDAVRGRDELVFALRAMREEPADEGRPQSDAGESSDSPADRPMWSARNSRTRSRSPSVSSISRLSVGSDSDDSEPPRRAKTPKEEPNKNRLSILSVSADASKGRKSEKEKKRRRSDASDTKLPDSVRSRSVDSREAREPKPDVPGRTPEPKPELPKPQTKQGTPKADKSPRAAARLNRLKKGETRGQ